MRCKHTWKKEIVGGKNKKTITLIFSVGQLVPVWSNIESSWSNREVGTDLYLCNFRQCFHVVQISSQVGQIERWGQFFICAAGRWGGRAGGHRWLAPRHHLPPDINWSALCVSVCVCFSPLLPFTLVLYCTLHPGGDVQLEMCAICWTPNIALSAWYQTAGDRWWVSSLVTPITGTRQLHSGGFNTIAPDIALYCLCSVSKCALLYIA